MFDNSPDQFNVAYHGYCATGVAMGKKIASNPQTFTVNRGVTYLFSSAEAKAMFDKDPDGSIARREVMAKVWNGAVLAESDRCVMLEGNRHFPASSAYGVTRVGFLEYVVASWVAVAPGTL